MLGMAMSNKASTGVELACAGGSCDTPEPVDPNIDNHQVLIWIIIVICVIFVIAGILVFYYWKKNRSKGRGVMKRNFSTTFANDDDAEDKDQTEWRFNANI